MITESRLQSECFLYHWNNYPHERKRLFMVHNNPKDKRDGAILKGMGMVKGVSDMIYLKTLQVLFLEFKLPGQYQTPDQVAFQSIVEALGFKYIIVTSLEQFKLIIDGRW